MLVSTKHQHESAVGLLMSPPTWTSLPPSPPSHPSRLLPSPSLSSLSHVANSHWLSVLHMVMYVSMLFSPYLPHSPSSPTSCVHKSILNVCISIAALQIVHQYHLSRFHIYALVYGICFSLSDLLHSRFVHVIRTDSNVFLYYGWVIFHFKYVPQLLYPLICWWTSGLLPCPSYCK